MTKISLFYKACRSIYGSPRFYRDLVDTGEIVGVNRVAKLMQNYEMLSKMAHKIVITTDPSATDHGFLLTGYESLQK